MEDETVRVRTATTLRSLKRQARHLAECEAPQMGSSIKRKAVRSAFVSRQTGRHYARLLAEHVSNLEHERDETLRSVNETAAHVKALRQWLTWNSSRFSERQSTSLLDDVIEGKNAPSFHDESLIWSR